MLPSRPWLVVAIAAGAVVVATGGTLAHVRAATLETQREQVSQLAQAVTDETDSGLQGADAGLAAMRAELQDGRLAADGADVASALQRRAGHMPLVETLWLVDDGWNAIAASDSSPPPPVAALAAGPDAPGHADLVIGQPAPTGTAGTTRVILARRFSAPPGQASGWILAAVPEAALLGRFGAADPPRDTRIAIFRADGVRLAGRLEDAQGPAEPFSALRLTALHVDQIHRFRDGSERLVGMHDARHYDVTVVLTRDLDTVLSGWRLAARIAALALAVAVALAGATLLFRHRPAAGGAGN
jgi:hypothetical protein